MSLINQMLNDLEARRSASVDSNKSVLDDLSSTYSRRRGGLSFFKLIFFLLVIIAGVYAWYKWYPESFESVLRLIPGNSEVVKKAPVKSEIVTALANRGSIIKSVDAERIVLVEPAEVEEKTREVEEKQNLLDEIKQEPVSEAEPAPVNAIAEVEEPAPITVAPGILAVLPDPVIGNRQRQPILLTGTGFVLGIQVSVTWGGGLGKKELAPEQIIVDSSNVLRIFINPGTGPDKWTVQAKYPDGRQSSPFQFQVVASPQSTAADSISSATTGTTLPRQQGVLAKKIHPRSLQERANAAYNKGASLLKSGQIAIAETRLRKALELNPQHVKARELLAGILLKSERTQEAASIISDGIRMHPDQWAFPGLYAHLLIKQGDNKAALDALTRKIPDIEKATEYHALLAAVYQRLGQYANAATTYRKLVSIMPRKGVWWMGLGISLEAEGKMQDAINAFSRARRTNTLNSELLRFVDQRLSRLQAQ